MNTFPYCIIGGIKLISENSNIQGVGILIDKNQVLTSSDAITPLTGNKRVFVDCNQIFFVYNKVEYQAKHLFRFQNYKHLEILKKIFEESNSCPEAKHTFFHQHVLDFVKSNITIIELKEEVQCDFPTSYFNRIHQSIIGKPYTLLEDNQQVEVKIVSLISKDIISKEKTKMFEPTFNKDLFNIELRTVANYSNDYAYLLFDLKAYDFFCGSPIFVNFNGEDLLVGLFTTTLRNNSENFDLVTNYPNIPNSVGFKFIDLQSLKQYKVLREEHLCVLNAKYIGYCFQFFKLIMHLDLDSNRLGEQGMKKVVQSLQYLTHLRKLGFGYNNIQLEGAKLVSPFLKYFLFLKELDLSGNNIGNQGIECIASSFPYLVNLKRLYLGFNNINEAGAQSLASYFHCLPKLKILSLQGNQINEDGGRYLSEKMHFLKNLTDLNMENCNIGEEGAILLAQPLKTLTKIVKLDLFGNNMGPRGGKEISKAIYNLKFLTKFYIGMNNLGEEGAVAFSFCYESLTNLKEMGSIGNNIGDKGMEEMAKYLVSLKNLKRLYVQKNNIGDQGARALANVLHCLPNLIVLSLDGNNISEVMKNEIEKHIPEGCSLFI